MAHPCVSDPPIVEMGIKDKDSEDTETEEMPQTMDDVDLEEGEIVDSCCEMYGDSDKESRKLPGSAENTAIHTSEGGEDLDMAGRKKKRKKKKKRKDDGLNDQGKPKKKKRYIDHDRVEDDETWFAINPMPYPKKNFNRIIEDGRSPSPGSYDNLLFNAEKKSSPSQDEDESKPKEEKERRNKKVMRKNANRRQNAERGGKKKRKDGGRTGAESKKRSALNKKRKIAKAKTRPLCKFFMEGRCSKGPDCPFSHATLPSVKKEICKFYLNGYCAKGPKCLYMHGEFPCKFFHTGAKCFSESNCLFSHDPLTEETSKLLDKYLESSKAEENKMDGSGPEDVGSPPKQQKRPSLLGSPPRHVKEAAETWRWQQHVLQMQQKRYPGPCNAPPILSPPHSFSRPNFYMDTLSRSPNKIPSLMSLPPISMPIGLNVHLPPHPMDMPNPYSGIPEGESSSQDEWENNKPPNCKEIDAELLESKIAQIKESSAIHSTVKNFEAKDQNNVKNVKNVNENSSDENSAKLGIGESNDVTNSSQDSQLLLQQSANSPPAEANLPPPSVVIPTHLPRRQRELYLRIQQHQKEAASGDSGTDGGDVSEDPEGKAEDEKKENWYSSDEDDTEDQPLTAVLKKLREMPPPNRSHQNLGQPFSSNSTIDITKMLTEIRQNATQNPEINGNISNQQSDFWQNLLGTIPSENAPNKQGIRDPRMRPNPCKPQMLNMAEMSNKSPPFRDPRLLNRDPRLASRDPRVTPPVINNNPIPPRSLPEKPPQPPWEIRPVVNKPNEVIVENNKPVGNHIQYKLRSITPSQPNYSSYVFQCQSDPKLLNDPRLKKYFKQMSGLLRQQQHLTDNVGPPGISEQNKKNHLDSQIKPAITANDNIGQPANLEHWEASKPRITDPRILKSSNLPPRLRPAENISPPQNMPSEPPWTTSAMNHTTSTTTVTSHLPKSVSDPRLTRLLHPPVDQRWHRSSEQNQLDSGSNGVGSQKKPNVASTSPPAVPSKSQQDSSKEASVSPPTNNNNNNNNTNNTKEQSSKEVTDSKESSESKKKSTTFNRKSSMNYSSPLSSYDDNSSSSSTGYNSYNRRPQPPQNPATTKAQPNIPQTVTNTSTANEHVSQESSGHSQSSPFLVSEPPNEPVLAPEHTPSLKEVFKTIDPTASPFC